MSFIYVADGIDDVLAAHLNQYADAWSGVAGKGQPFNAVAVNDPINFAISARNLDPTNSRAAQFLKADGTVLFQVDASGVKVSPDGTVAGVPVTVNATQTLTNKTLGATNSIATAAIATNAVTQNAQSQIATGSTASLTAVDTGLTVTLTTTGGDMLLIATLVSSNSGANTLFLNFARDGANIGNVGKVTASGAGATRTTTVALRDPAPSAAVHIYRLQYSVSAGTETIDTAIFSTMIAVELKR